MKISKKIKEPKVIKHYLPKYWVGVVIIFLGLFLIFAAVWLKGMRIDELLFYANTDLTESNNSVIMNFIIDVVPEAIGITVLYVILTAAGSRKARTYLVMRVKNKEFRIALFPLKFASKHARLCGFSMILIGVLVLNNNLNFVDYFKNSNTSSDLYESKYVDPSEISFVSSGRNLIYIYLESMENTFSDTENGGAYNVSRIPELTKMAQNNVSFSNTESLGGAMEAPGTTWTSASLVAQTSGVPLKPTASGDAANKEFENVSKFMPGAYTLGDVLNDAGYTQEFLLGSDAEFAGRKTYFTEHGNYAIKDYNYAVKSGWIPSDYFEFWGFEDEKLFEFAKSELTELSTQSQPFNLTMLTVDTHFVGGYRCELCKDSFDDQYSNVLSCSSRQVYNFVKWIKQQPFYENTTIVISGDHVTMDNDYVSSIGSDYERTVYNCIINSTVDTYNTVNRKFAVFDMYPTTLAALGFTWEGDHLGLGTNLFSNSPTRMEQLGVDKLYSEINRKSDFYENQLMQRE